MTDHTPRKHALRELARFDEAPLFRWIDEAGAVRRAVLVIREGQSFGTERLASPVSLLVVEGQVTITLDNQVVDLVAGDMLDIPRFLEHAITAQRRAILWLHRYEETDDA